MSNRQKSLFRGPGVKHYALIHRSVRDPALNEDGAAERVLAELPKKQGRTKQDLEGLLQKDGGLADMRANEGEAAGFGIYYDDSKYDYMQHLRVVGQNVDAQLVEAPRRNDSKGKGKALSMTLKEEEEHRAAVDQQGSYRGYLEGTAQAEGLRPDMDPALREVLEALEDDAYIADGVEEQASSDVATGNGEDFFSNLIAGSRKGDFRDTPFDDDDEDFLDEDEEGEYEDEIDGLDPNSAYAQEVLRFKKPKGAADSDDDLSDEEYEASEGGDTIAALQAASARRPPRKAGPSDKRSSASASAFSMSSSAMFRNEGLQTLDDRFDQIEQMYDEDESDDDDEPTELGAGRQQQFDHAMDEFLMKYEVVAGKMRQTIGDAGTSGADKLGAIREDFEKMQVLDHVKRQQREERLIAIARKKADRTLDDELWDLVRDIDVKEDKWDCESILSTYSNIENHPRMLKIRGALNAKSGKSTKQAQQPKITIDPKTGFPVVLGPDDAAIPEAESDAESDSTMDAEDLNNGTKRHTIARPKGETPEQKKARKEQAKVEKQSRRQEKKATKQAFGTERKRQMKVNKNQFVNAADVSKGNGRKIEVMSLS